MSKNRLAQIFNQWIINYSQNPDGFTKLLDDNGYPIHDYGTLCAEYFTRLSKKFEKKAS